MDRAKPDHVVLNMDQESLNKFQSMEGAGVKDQITREEKSHHTATRAKSLRRLSFSKPKSRFLEYNYAAVTQNSTIPESNNIESSPQKRDSLSSSSSEEDEDEWSDDEAWLEEDDDGGAEKRRSRGKFRKNKRKFNWRLFAEWVLFLAIMTCLLCSLTIADLKHQILWGLEIWKWCLMVMVTFCGRLVSGWVISFVVFLIERNFMLREKVLYFVYGLRKSIQNCVWLALVLLAWTIMFNAEVHRRNRILKKVFRALVAALLDATIWLIKIVLVKLMASSFHVATYFERMKESVFHHYILDTLSGPPMDGAFDQGRQIQNLTESKSMPSNWKQGKWKEARNAFKSKKFGSRKIDMEKLRKLSMERTASAWKMKRLVNYIMSSGLATISRTVDDFSKAESEITSEWEARNAARRIFKNVAKPGAKYIEEEDLMRFLKRVEVHTIFPLFEGAMETGRISKLAFRNWVVRAYFERKSLAHSLNDTKTAVQQLHKLASAIVTVFIIVVTILVMELTTVQVMLFVISQIIIMGVIFQNMCKTVFESIVFVFVMHPFDIGDRCVVDGVQMIVEEMNILTTVFLRYDMEKIYYPNAVLLTKPISNFYRSPEMGDGIEFAIDISTPVDTITALKKAIQGYIESKPNYWNPKHSVVMKEIVNVQSIKMALYVQHTINHQNYGERTSRISELVMELKKIFENLGITYRLLPQEIHLTQVNMDASWRIPTSHP